MLPTTRNPTLVEIGAALCGCPTPPRGDYPESSLHRRGLKQSQSSPQSSPDHSASPAHWARAGLSGDSLIGRTGMRRELSHLHDQPLDLFATALTVLLCAIWGGAFVAIKISTLDMPPLGSGAVRFCLTSLVLLVWARYQRVPLCYGWAEIKTLAVLAGGITQK